MEQEYIRNIVDQYNAAKQHRSSWESLWQECYDYTLPQRKYSKLSSHRKHEDLYDATAMDAVDQLAASLLGNLTPSWTPWFGFKPGPELSDAEAGFDYSFA